MDYKKYKKSIEGKSGEYYYKNKYIENSLFGRFGGDNFASELILGRDRVDLLEVNNSDGWFTHRIIEVKSDLDSIKNINTQLDKYYKYTNKISLCIDYKFLYTKEIQNLNIDRITHDNDNSNIVIVDLHKNNLLLSKESMFNTLNLKMKKDSLLFNDRLNIDELKKLNSIQIHKKLRLFWNMYNEYDSMNEFSRLLYNHKTYSADCFNNRNPNLLLYNLHNFQEINK